MKNSPTLFRKLAELRKGSGSSDTKASQEDLRSTSSNEDESQQRQQPQQLPTSTQSTPPHSRKSRKSSMDSLRTPSVEHSLAPLDETRRVEVTSAPSSKSDSEQITLKVPQRTQTQQAEAKPFLQSVKSTLQNLDKVGELKVELIHASGLYGADLNGKSDPFVVLHLGDQDFRSKTIKKTNNPEWKETFSITITDMTDVFYLSVWDEDRFNDPEFLGRLAIPLLRIISDEHEQTFALKDRKYQERAKGNHPQITLRFDLKWSKPLAAIQTIRSNKPMEDVPFKRSLFIANVQRMRKVLYFLKSVGDYMESCFSWEKPTRSIKAFIAYELLVYYFQPCIIPLLIIGFMFIYPVYATDLIIDWFDPYSEFEGSVNDETVEDDAEAEVASTAEESSSTLSEKYKAVQDVTAFVQNTLGLVASTAERIKNVITFSEPFMSWLAIGFFTASALILYFIPLRALLMVYGVNKFSKKLIRPNHKSSSEIWNFLCRVPDDCAISWSRELSLYDPELLRQEEEDRQKRENSTSSKLVKRVSSFFHKDRDRSNKRQSKDNQEKKSSQEAPS